MLLMCASDAFWLSTTLLLLFGVLRDEYRFIRPHLYLTVSVAVKNWHDT